MPKVIASGESVTIPAGRVAILPDVQVDGTLNVLGDIFIPTGTANSKVVQKVTSTDKAVPRFNGTTGDIQNSGVTIDDNNNVTATTFSLNNGKGTMLYESPNMEFIGLNTDTIFGNTGAFNTKFCTNGTERMTLDASGNLLVGTNSQILASRASFSYNGQGNGGSFDTTATINSYTALALRRGNAGNLLELWNGNSQIGAIYANSSSVTYNTTSDHRLKENIRPADCKKFMDIKFVDYERIDGRHECGVIAHELQEIYPDLVTGEKDATEIRKVEISPAIEEVKDEDGNIIVEAVEAVYEEQEFPVYQQVNYIGLIARIGTVVQQQAKLIEAMRAEIDELKGAK